MITDFENLIWLFNSTIESRGIVRLNIAEGALLYKYSKKKHDDILLEIGRKHGGSTVLMAAPLTTGKLYSIDIKYHKKEVERSIKSWKNKITLINEDSQKVKFNMLLGLLFIDGNHREDAVWKDVKKFIPFVKEDGFVIFHDAGKRGISDIIKKLKKNGWYKVEKIDTMVVIAKKNL